MQCQWLVFIVLCTSSTECARILYSAPFGSKSHQNSYVAVIQALAERDHHVTLITNYAVEKLRPLANVRQIHVDALKIDDSMFGDAFQKAIGAGGSASALGGALGVVDMLKKLDSMAMKVANETYSHPQVLEMLDVDSFDLVIVSQFYGISGYPLAWHFNATLAMFSPGGLFAGIADVLGDSDHTEYIPNPVLELNNRMSLTQRVVNTVSLKIFEQLFSQRHKSSVRALVEKILPGCPALDDIERETRLVFTNSHPIFHYARPMTPEMVEIGAVHCTPARPLPPKLEAFVGDHQAGFIMFGVGSAVNMNDMPVAMVDAFIQVFRQLPQRVIWQWKGKQRENMPANIMTVDWMPQQDLLGHINCRLFLTHGGLNSMMEAVYHGVPVLGLPLSTDQFSNIARAQREGYAMTLKWSDINEETLSNTIHQLLNNPTYSETAERLSTLLRDQPQTPLERAIYWIEFQLRHKEGQHYGLGSRYLAAYQRAMIDVYAVLLAMFLLPILIAALILRTCCCAPLKPTKDAKKEQ